MHGVKSTSKPRWLATKYQCFVHLVLADQQFPVSVVIVTAISAVHEQTYPIRCGCLSGIICPLNNYNHED